MRARKRFGQHFLESAWVDKVLRAISPAVGDRFLEIGAGRGALTVPLARAVSHVFAVEVDRDLAASLRRHVPDNVEVIEGDVLALDLESYLDSSGSPWRVAGNLPYNITSPILARLFRLQSQGVHVAEATLMVQREVAERLAARPGTGDYGVLTVTTQRLAHVERILDLPPGAFRPAPKVHSALVRLRFRSGDDVLRVPDHFDDLVRAVFGQRRKKLANALRPFAEASGQSAGAALASAGIDPGRRPETLSLSEYVGLARAFNPGPSSRRSGTGDRQR